MSRRAAVTLRCHRKTLRGGAGLLNTVRSIEGREVSEFAQLQSAVYSNANRATWSRMPGAWVAAW